MIASGLLQETRDGQDTRLPDHPLSRASWWRLCCYL